MVTPATASELALDMVAERPASKMTMPPATGSMSVAIVGKARSAFVKFGKFLYAAMPIIAGKRAKPKYRIPDMTKALRISSMVLPE